MNIVNIVLYIGLGIIIYAIGYIVGFQTCRERTVEKLIDLLMEDLEGEDDK